MTVWSHLSTVFKQRHALRLAGLLTLFVAFITTLLLNSAAYAAPGVNQTLNFQGRLLNASGGTVPDGNYNMQFKIYQDGTANSPGTLKWTESHLNTASHGIMVKNGYFSVTLGSVAAFGNDVDWNQDTLYLSMNVGNTAGGCTPFSSCGADGEMIPMKRLTSVPFAMNAGRLEGRSADGFIQNSTSPQTADFNITGTGTAASLQAANLDTASAGTLTIGGANATSITMADDVTVAAGKSLTMAGGTTASRPASPTEGMMYFDTDTKQLLIYANGKWQSNGKATTKIVAASNSPQTIKDNADYVADGTGDQAEINAALTAAAGGKVYLAEGTYTIAASISVPNDTTLAGSGAATVITVPNSFNSSINALTNSTTGGNGKGVVIQDMKLDGNRANQASGSMRGIYFTGIGSGADSSAVQGGKISNVHADNWNTHGIYVTSSANSAITGNSAQNSYTGIEVNASAQVTITHNAARGGATGIRVTSNTGVATVSNNTVSSVSGSGIYMQNNSTAVSVSNNTLMSNNVGLELSLSSSANITGNVISNSTTNGMSMSYASYSTITSNTVRLSGGNGINFGSSTNNTVSTNTFYDNGGSSTNNALYLINSDNNSLTNNTINDSSATTTNYAIVISDANSDTNYLAGNTLGGGSINDQGTGTILGGQVGTGSNYIIQPAGTIELMKNTNVTGALSASTSVLAPVVDRATAGTLTIGSDAATAITIGRTNANTATTLLGTALFKPTTGNDSTTAFQIQRASGTAMFTADSTNQTITIGDPASANKTIISTATGKITKYGTARNEKKISLTAEYTGAVLNAGSGSNNNGTMTSSFDIASRMNYYKWTTSQGSNQNYDVVVQVPLPNDFDGWAATPLAVSTYTSNTTNGTITLEARDSTGTVRCNFVSVTPGSTNTWATDTSACTLGTGTYTAGDYITLRLRMQSPNSGDVRIGNINLNYLSKD